MSEFDAGKIWAGWETDGIIGSGSFGTVYLVRSIIENRTVFAAAKVIDTPPSDDAITNAEKMGIGADLLTTYFGKFKNELNWEITMYKTVSSPYLGFIDDAVLEDKNGPGWRGYIRTALYTPLNVYFEKVKPTDEDAARMGLELCEALEVCEEYGMVHGGVKPGNVMVNDAGAFVLTDFAVRRCLEKAGSGLFGNVDSEFDAPELNEERKYTTSSDIYALGMTMC